MLAVRSRSASSSPRTIHHLTAPPGGVHAGGVVVGGLRSGRLVRHGCQGLEAQPVRVAVGFQEHGLDPLRSSRRGRIGRHDTAGLRPSGAAVDRLEP